MGCFLGFLGASWAPLGASWGDLEPSWGEIGVVLGDFSGTSIFDIFWERFWEPKGYPKGGILGAKTEQKSIQNRGANLRAKKSPLGVVLDRFWLDFQSVLGSNMLIFHWFLKVFVKINLFDEDWYPRAIRTPKWSKKGAKMAPKWLPKRIKNRSQNMIDFLIDF